MFQECTLSIIQVFPVQTFIEKNISSVKAVRAISVCPSDKMKSGQIKILTFTGPKFDNINELMYQLETGDRSLYCDEALVNFYCCLLFWTPANGVLHSPRDWLFGQ